MSVLAISPTSIFVTPNGRANFSATGGTAPYTFSISSNRSGGSINPTTGLYQAGPRGICPDQVTVTDAASSTATALVNVTGGLYQQAQRTLGPPWTRNGTGPTWEADSAAEKDTAFERMRQGLLANFPGLGPPDALDLIAEERQLPRATTESPSDDGGPNDTALAARLQVCWTDDHGWLPASAFAPMLYALDRAGFPMGDPSGAHVVQRWNRYGWLTASGGTPVYGSHPSPWTFDASDPRFWNQFGLIFGADVSGLSAGTELAAQLNAIVRLWKPSKAAFMGTWIILSGSIWGWPITAKWGDSGRLWGGSSRFVPPV